MKTPTTFHTTNASPNFWTGFAKQTIDFQHALGELVDNALSATLPAPAGNKRQRAVIEICLEEHADQRITVLVADAGTGVPWGDLTGGDNIFNLGFTPSSRGYMNEHGFGLKNALALMTGGFDQEFAFYSKPAVEPGEIYKICGPISPTMTAESTGADEWQDGLEILKSVPSGVKVRVDVKRGYFKTVYGRPVGFEGMVERLGEHLGVMYSEYLSQGDQIFIRYKSNNAPSFIQKEVISIPTPFLKNAAVSVTENRIHFEVDGVQYTADYRQGVLDASVRSVSSERPWPYPLRIHCSLRCHVDG